MNDPRRIGLSLSLTTESGDPYEVIAGLLKLLDAATWEIGDITLMVHKDLEEYERST